ncbi:MAG: DUF4235 domain-containing protein [Bowdeniella nasicola]|nr:DUF4235 domain-containing protein [Bowdeniella nasicola]
MDIGWKLVSAGSMAVASALASKVVTIGWKAVTGHQPPEDPQDPSVRLAEVLTFAVISGALMGLSKQLALAGASKWYGGKERDPQMA